MFNVASLSSTRGHLFLKWLGMSESGVPTSTGRDRENIPTPWRAKEMALLSIGGH